MKRSEGFFDANEFYRIHKWGQGYFAVNEKGHLSVLPDKDESRAKIDLLEVIEEMKRQKIGLPSVIRFHDILHSRVKEINEAFRKTIREAEFQGKYVGVYPIKVNQMREVVEEVIEAGKPYDLGLEAGSKPELLSVLALNDHPDALTILNGYKDQEYMRLAMLGRKLGLKVIVVIEKFSELASLMKVSKEVGVDPLIGIRVKISSRGGGKWSDSGGDQAKFGLTVAEVLGVVEKLKEDSKIDCLKLLHFHIGSQVTTIQSIKEAVDESARIYAQLYRRGIPLDFFDVGGGLGVDYDGLKGNSESSMNYTTEEYVSDVVYGLAQICDVEGVPHPHLISESGRALTAHHSCIVTNVIGEIDPFRHRFDHYVYKEDHILVKNMRDSLEELNQENFQEIYNDSLSIKDDAISAFKLGVLSLEERAKVETFFGRICTRILEFLEGIEVIPEDFKSFKDKMAKQYLCNFSVFQSLPDVWAINQVIPVVPISRLHERPTEICSLVDITCDSDGKIDTFIENDHSSGSLKLHKLKKGEEYYLGFFLTGAYQDVMGDMHNLFGRLNEVHVYYDEKDPEDFYIEEFIRGSSSKEVLSTMQYNADHLSSLIKRKFDRQVKAGRIPPKEGVRFSEFYKSCLFRYTYLSNERERDQKGERS